MSENALKRISIVMARDNGAFDPSLKLSAQAIKRRLETCFPNHHYNLMTVKLFLVRLYDARTIRLAGLKGHPPTYSLNETGFDQAKEHWKERNGLGYIEPAAPDQSILHASAVLTPATANTAT